MNQWEQANTLNESQIINSFHTNIDHLYLIFANYVKKFDKGREKVVLKNLITDIFSL